MSNSVQVSISTAGRAYRLPPNGSPSSSWKYDTSRLCAGQQGAEPQYAYCSFLECAFPQISFQALNKLTLTLKYDKYAAPSTSAVLFSKMLTPKEAFALDENVSSQDGYIFHCLTSTSMTNIDANAGMGTITWEFNFDSTLQDKLQRLFGASREAKFYIYIKRQLGEQEKPRSYYTTLVNPALNGIDTESLTLEYTTGGYYLSPSSCSISGMSDITKSFRVYQKGADGEADQIVEDNLTWECNSTDGVLRTIEFDEHGKGDFTFKPPFTPGQVKIVAWLGSVALTSIVTFPPKWDGLKSWLVGYAIKMMGQFIPPSAITAYKYKNDIILPAFIPYSFSEQAMAEVSICIAEDPVLNNTYYFYWTQKGGYIYDTERNLVHSGKASFVYKIDNKTKKWVQTGVKADFYIDPLWTSEDIKDVEGNIKIKTYTPIPIYGKEG